MAKFTGRATLLAAAMSLTTSLPAQALGLGVLEVDSSLFRPVRARIPLIGLGDVNSDDVHVELASPMEFLNLGIDHPRSLKDLVLRIGTDGGQSYIDVSTRVPQREPVMQFLVSVEWPGGRLLREYTALFDPPGWEIEPAVTEIEDLVAPEAWAASGSESPAEAESSTETQVSPTYEVVRDGETLWRIASRHVGPGADINQVMVALLETNPAAFAQGDINQLQRGSRLRVPDLNSMAGIDAADAALRVRGQLDRPQPTAPSAEAASPVATSSPANTAAAPQQSSAPTITLSAPAGTANNFAPPAALSDTALQQQVVDLRRIVSLKEEQVGKLERVLARRDAQVATLRHLVELSEAEVQAQREEPKPQTAPVEAAVVAAAAPVITLLPKPVVAPVIASSTAPQAEPGGAASGFEGMLTWMLGGLLGALGLLGIYGAFRGFVRYRAQLRVNPVKQEAKPASTLSPSIHSQLQDTLGHLEVEDGDGSAAEPVRDQTPVVETIEEQAEPQLSSTGQISPRTPAMTNAVAVVAGAQITDAEALSGFGDDASNDAQGDMQRLLQEIDVYLAYGLPDQAQKLVTQGLVSEPESPELIVKQLDVLMAAGEAEAFERYARENAGRIDSARLDGMKKRAEAAGFDVSALDAERFDDAEIDALVADDTMDLSQHDDLSLLLDESLEFDAEQNPAKPISREFSPSVPQKQRYG